MELLTLQPQYPRTGWYGKLPSLGDFASRRLQAGFIERWDDWLQQSMGASRELLGEDWTDLYLGCHVWRFVLMPGVIGAEAWAGVLMPSVDRVGRYFPLTICTSMPARAPLGMSLSSLDHWLEQLELCALSALDPDGGLDSLESGLQGLPALQLGPRSEGLGAESALMFFAAGEKTASSLEQMAARMLPDSLRGKSLWWCSDEQGSGAGLIRPNLPGVQDFLSMLSCRPAG